MGADWLPGSVRAVLSEPEKRVYVACSGGADSVFLLLWFWAFRQQSGLAGEIVVLHFNHCLRGEESDGDQVYVEDLAKALGVSVESGSWVRGAEVKISEETARNARLDFFDRCIGDEGEGAFVLTGHHADDAVESMLMRLSRGSGSIGLSSPRPISELGRMFRVVRPLINLKRGDIQGALEALGTDWREDASNSESDYYRNRLRNSVVPAWQEAADREVSVGVGLSRRLLEEDADALEVWLEREWLELIRDDGRLGLKSLVELPVALRRRALQRFVDCSNEEDVSFPLSVVEKVLAALEKGGSLKLSVGANKVFIVDSVSGSLFLETIAVTREWSAFRLPMDTTAYFPGVGRITAGLVRLRAEVRNEILSGKVGYENCVFLCCPEKQLNSLQVRSWREGDAYVPIGLSGPKKMSRMFADRKISKNSRRSLPLFVDSRGNVLWGPGLPPNKLFQIDSDTTHALQLTYEA